MIFKNFLISLIFISFCFFHLLFLIGNLLFLDDIAPDLSSPLLYSIKTQHLFVFTLSNLALIDVQIVFEDVKLIVAQRLFFLLEDKSLPDLQTTIIAKFFNCLGQSLFLLGFMF